MEFTGGIDGIVGAIDAGLGGIGMLGMLDTLGVLVLGLPEIGIIKELFGSDFIVTDAKNIKARVARAYDNIAHTRENIQNGKIV